MAKVGFEARIRVFERQEKIHAHQGQSCVIGFQVNSATNMQSALQQFAILNINKGAKLKRNNYLMYSTNMLEKEQ